jgi:hypothetical protein
MQHEQADPAGSVDGIFMRVMARLGDRARMSWIAMMP